MKNKYINLSVWVGLFAVLAVVLVEIYFFVGHPGRLAVSDAALEVSASKHLWEHKITPTKDVNIGLITDTQISSALKSEGGEQTRYIEDMYAEAIDLFIDHVVQVNPDFIVHLGDIIDGTDIEREVGIDEITLVREKFDALTQKVWWTLGNHDLRSVTRRDFQEVLGTDYANTFFDDSENRFVVLDTSYRGEGIPNNPLSKDFVPGFVPKETFAWLRETLNTDKNVYVFMHHTPVPYKMTNKHQLNNSSQLRELFTQYNVNTVFSGHIEKRFYGELEGVRYYTMPGIWKNPQYVGSFYDVFLKGGIPEVVMHYKNKGEDELVTEPFVTAGKMVSDVMRKKEAKEAKEAGEAKEGDE